MFVQISNAAGKIEMIGKVQIPYEGLQLSEIAGLQHIAGDAERDVWKARHDGCGCLDENVMSFSPANVAYCGNEIFAWSLNGPEEGGPIGEVEAVVDGLNAGRIDSIDLDAMLANFFRDREDRIRHIGHEPIGDVVFAGPENSQI